MQLRTIRRRIIRGMECLVPGSRIGHRHHEETVTNKGKGMMSAIKASGQGLGAELETAASLFSDRQVEEVVHQFYGISGKSTWLWGEKDSNHQLDVDDGRTLLVKVLNAAEDPATTSMHSQALLHVADRDPAIPVQRIVPPLSGEADCEIRDAEGQVRRLRVVTFLDGQALTSSPRSAVQRSRAGVLMGRLQTALQSFSHPAETQTITWDLAQAPTMRSVLSVFPDVTERATLSWCLTMFEQQVVPLKASLPSQVIHNDFNTENILVDPADPDRITGIIDFGDMVFGPAVFDVAVGATYQIANPADPIPDIVDFLRGYASVRTLGRQETDLIYACMMARLVMRIAIPAWRISLFPDQADKLSVRFDLVRRLIAGLRAVNPQEAADQFAAVFQKDTP